MKFLLTRDTEVIYEVTDSNENLFAVLNGFMRLDIVKQNLFGRTDLTITNHGVKNIIYDVENDIWTSAGGLSDGRVDKSPTTCVIGYSERIEDETTFLEYQDAEGTHVAPFKIKFEAWQEGYILNAGKELYGLYSKYQGYLTGITSKRATFGLRAHAKVFTAKQLERFIKTKYGQLSYLVENKSCKWSIEHTCRMFKPSLKDLNKLMELNKMLNIINLPIDDDEEEVEMEGMATDEEMKVEALARMKSLEMMNDVVQDFVAHGRVWKSEFNGILYHLDDDTECENALANLHKDYLPYHVIKDHLQIEGNQMCLISVLGVSRDKSLWNSERKGKGDYLNCFVYNPDYEDYEYGSIGVTPNFGGVIRTK